MALEPLRVLRQTTFAWGAATIRCCILGASHALEIVDGDAHLTELLTCASPPDHAALFLDGEGTTAGEVAGYEWVVGLGRCALDTSVAGDTFLEASFPGHPDARTVVGWRERDGFLIVESLHAYPEEGAGLYGTTIVRRVSTR